MNKAPFFLSAILLLTPLIIFGGRANASSTSSSGVSFTREQWNEAKRRFDEAIAAGGDWLGKYRARKDLLTQEIVDLRKKTTALRQETESESNVFKEIKLKSLLNELKDKLEENSKLEHEFDDKQKDFEQKCLSLIALVNDRIEAELDAGESGPSVQPLDGKLNELTLLIRERGRIQNLLKRYQKKEDVEKLPSLKSIGSLNTRDRETLQLTLDLFQDRMKSLQEQIDRWTLEEDGVRNEIKLQGEMQDFLEDIQKMNADSNFPQGNLKNGDLESLVGGSQKNKLAVHLNELRQKIKKGQRSLVQMNQLMDTVRDRLNSLNERKRP